MEIYGVPIIGELRDNQELLEQVMSKTTLKDWEGLKGVYILYRDLYNYPENCRHGSYIIMEKGAFVELGHHPGNVIRLEGVKDSPCIVLDGDNPEKIFMEYVLLHELGHHKGYDEKDADRYALRIIKDTYEDVTVYFNESGSLTEIAEELGVKTEKISS